MNFMLRAEKHQTIKIAAKTDRAKVYILNDSNHNLVAQRVSTKFVLVRYHLCFILVHNRGRLSKRVGYKFQNPSHMINVELRNKSSVHQNISSNVKKLTNHYQLVYQIFSTDNKFINIHIKRVVYTGWKVLLCLFGGLAFMEPLGAYDKEYQSSVCVITTQRRKWLQTTFLLDPKY